MESCLELLKSRRSIRRFKEERPPLQLIRRALDCARYAPSAHNSHPWRFILVCDKKSKTKLIDAMAKAWKEDLIKLDGLEEKEAEKVVHKGSYERFSKVPYLILACLDRREFVLYKDEKRKAAECLMGVQSLATAVQNLLLGLHALELGACWNCAPLFCQAEIRKALNLPEYVEPQALVLVGYPAHRPKPKALKPLSEILHFNRW